MRKSKFSETQIVGILKDAEAGVAVNDRLRTHGISRARTVREFSRRGVRPGLVGVGSALDGAISAVHPRGCSDGLGDPAKSRRPWHIWSKRIASCGPTPGAACG